MTGFDRKPHIFGVYVTKAAGPDSDFHIWSDHDTMALAQESAEGAKARGYRVKIRKVKLSSQELADWNRGEEYMIPVVL